MRIVINADGTINALGYQDNYPLPCPDFITLENAMHMKCINLSDHLNSDSWVEIEPEPTT